MEQSLNYKCHKVCFEVAIYWYRVAEDIFSDAAFARGTVTALSGSWRISLAMLAFAPWAGKPYRIASDESVEDEILSMILLNTGLTYRCYIRLYFNSRRWANASLPLEKNQQVYKSPSKKKKNTAFSQL